MPDRLVPPRQKRFVRRRQSPRPPAKPPPVSNPRLPVLAPTPPRPPLVPPVPKYGWTGRLHEMDLQEQEAAEVPWANSHLSTQNHLPLHSRMRTPVSPPPTSLSQLPEGTATRTPKPPGPDPNPNPAGSQASFLSESPMHRAHPVAGGSRGSRGSSRRGLGTPLTCRLHDHAPLAMPLSSLHGGGVGVFP